MSQTELPSWKPRSYQAEGVRLMISQASAGLLMDPGLGKTSCTYMALKILLQQGFIKRGLVICPLRPAYRVWPHQKDKYAEFADLRVCVLHGKDKEALLADPNYDIYVINPEGLDWLLAPAKLPAVKKMFDTLVVDESTKFKNPQTKRFKLLKTMIPHFKRRYILTGTPTPKGLMDLFGQVYILDEGATLGRYITHYRNEFFYPSGFGGYDWKPMHDAAKRIGDKIAPYVLRVAAKGNIELPELMFDDIWVDLPPAAMKLYQQMEEQMIISLASDDVVAANAAVASSKCRQIANGHIFTGVDDWQHVHDAKLDALGDLIEQLQGEPLLVTYEFKFDAAALAAKFKMPSISSGNIKKDDENVQRFSRGELEAVMGQPQSVSLGIDGLQDNCHHIAMLGVTWALQDYIQVIDRVRRSGSKSKHVVVHRILARGTVDERVLKVLDDRAATQANFMQLLKSLRS
jgi:SNF2 family DNA or RNA helicase